MGTTFKQLYNKLMGACDVVPVTIAKESINEALRDIYDANDWGFLYQNSYMRTPAIISGTANVSQFSSAVQVDAAVAVIIAGITEDNVPLVERQLRIKSPTQTDRGFFYNIIDYSAVAGAAASGSWQISTPSDGDIITLNGVVFTFRDTPIFSTDVQIDPFFNFEANSNNLYLAIIATNNPATNVVSYTDAGLGVRNLLYLSDGVIGNTFTLSTSAPGNITLSGATLTGGIDDAFGTLTIDPPYQDISVNGIQIEIVKFLYTAPQINIETSTSPNLVIDFRRFEYIVSPQDRRRIILDSSIDRRYSFDRYRENVGEPRYLIPYLANSNGDQLYELYPIPRNERVYRIRYIRNGTVLTRDSDQLPNNILSTELVLSRAKQRAYEWVIANQKKLGIQSVTGYFNLMALLDNRNNTSSYPRLLDKAIARDEELFPKSYMGDFSDYNYFDDFLYENYDMTLPHDRFGETLVIDASA